MEQPSTSRPKLIPRKFGTVSKGKIPGSYNNNNSDSFVPKKGVKRRNDTDISCGGKKTNNSVHNQSVASTSTNNYGKSKFSANARLMQYRKKLECKQNQIVKVHTLDRFNKEDYVNGIRDSSEAEDVSLEETNNYDRLKKYKNDLDIEKDSYDSDTQMNDQSQITSEIESNNLKDSYKTVISVRREGHKKVEKPCTYNTSVTEVTKSNQGEENISIHTKESLRISANNDSTNRRESGVYKNQNQHALENENTDMDWSPISEEQLLADINNLRQNSEQILNHKISFQANMATEIPTNNYIFKDTFIVVDTNIFLSHLNVAEYILNIKLNGVERPFVLIPWVVIQELDYMKDGRDSRPFLQKKARKAVDFINKNLILDTTLKGQSVIDASKHIIQSKDLDDGILACCLQVFERGNRAILLSNDKNLRNKALIHSVPAYSADEIFKELKISPPSKQTNETLRFAKSEEIKSHLTTLFNTVIHGEALIAYGDVYHKMGIFKDAPWNLEQCLSKFEKLWISVFSEKLPKQCLHNVEEFHRFLKNSKGIKYEADHEKLMKCGLNICLYLKNSLKDYYNLISQCIDKIVKLG